MHRRGHAAPFDGCRCRHRASDTRRSRAVGQGRGARHVQLCSCLIHRHGSGGLARVDVAVPSSASSKPAYV
eukprot:3499038-Prymnesium_polylepis.1